MLDEPVLVLNSGWVPVDVTTVFKSLCYMFNGRAKGLDIENYVAYDIEEWLEIDADNDGIKSANLCIKIPEVVILTDYAKVPMQSLRYSKRAVWARDKYTCQYCKDRLTSKEISIDHVVPRSQGGETSWTNCVACCMECNGRKADRTPKQAGMKLIREPVKPNLSKEYLVRTNSNKESWLPFLPKSKDEGA